MTQLISLSLTFSLALEILIWGRESMMLSLLFYGSCTQKPMGLSLQGWAPGGSLYWVPTKDPGCLSSPPRPLWTSRPSSTLCWGRRSPRGPVVPIFPLCGRQSNDPQNVHIPIPAACEYGTWCGKRDFTCVTKEPGRVAYLGGPRVTITKVFLRGWEVREDVTTEAEVGRLQYSWGPWAQDHGHLTQASRPKAALPSPWFQPSETLTSRTVGSHTCYFKPPSLRSFVTAATGSSCTL